MNDIYEAEKKIINAGNKSDGNNENILFGVVGAFLFSLVGGAVYLILDQIGYVAAISGLVGVVCAIKGYTFFSKSDSKRGVIISVIVAAVVLVIAWYVGFCFDMVEAYDMWFENGEVDYAPTLFEYIPYGVYDLTVNTSYFINLLMSLGLGAIGCWRYVANQLKKDSSQAPVENMQPINDFSQPADQYVQPEIVPDTQDNIEN